GCSLIVPAPRTSERLIRTEVVEEILRVARDGDHQAPPPSAGRAAERQRVARASPAPTPGESPMRTPRPRVVWLGGSVLLWAAGALLLIAAYFTSLSLDARDTQQAKIDDARFSAQSSIAHLAGSNPPTYHESPKSDRTIVYFLARLGAVS